MPSPANHSCCGRSDKLQNNIMFAQFELLAQPVLSINSAENLFALLIALIVCRRLTSLLKLVVDVAEDADPPAMVLALQGVQRLLAAVHAAQAAGPAAASVVPLVEPYFELKLKLHEGEATGEWHAHPQVWQIIGQLRGLEVLQFRAADPGVRMLHSSIAHVSALASLASSLQTLWIEPNLDKLQPAGQVVDYSALGSLSRLTALSLPLAAKRQGLSSITSCPQLQRLRLFKGAVGTARPLALQRSELSALGGLTELAELSLDGAACVDDASWSFLSSLQQLQQLCVKPGLPHAAVAALEPLAQLNELTCGWLPQEEVPLGEEPPDFTACCAAVRALHVVDGAPPFCAFPKLTSIVQYMPWAPAVLSSTAQYCTQLRELQMSAEFGGTAECQAGSLQRYGTSDRTAALRSLAALPHLQELALSVIDAAEVTAAAALPQVKQLVLVVYVRSWCNVQSLAELAPMRQLQSLAIELPCSSNSRIQAADVEPLLSALRHVQQVTIRVQKKYVRRVAGVVGRAERALTEQGVQLASKALVEAI